MRKKLYATAVTAIAVLGTATTPALAAQGGNPLQSNSDAAHACQQGGFVSQGDKNAGQCARNNGPAITAESLCTSYGGYYEVQPGIKWRCTYWYYDAYDLTFTDFKTKEAALNQQCAADGGTVIEGSTGSPGSYNTYCV